MNFGRWRNSLVEYIRAEAQPQDKFGHQPRLYALACRIGEGMDYDDDVLFAAAWMHDLGVFLGHRPSEPELLARWNHVPYTVARARDLLAGWGFPAARLDAVVEAIENHQPQDEPRQTEGFFCAMPISSNNWVQSELRARSPRLDATHVTQVFLRSFRFCGALQMRYPLNYGLPWRDS
jgi:hypothetical protein